MNKSLLAKVAVVVVILAAFIGYNIYTKWDETHFSADPEVFNIKDSYQALLEAQNQRYPYLNLKLARKFDLPKQLNQSVLLSDIHRKVTVHEMWFRFPGAYLLYSINLQKEDKDESDVPKLQFSTMQINTSGGKSVKANINKDVQRGRSEPGVVYNGKLYRGVLLLPNFDGTHFNIFESFQNKTINKITLKDPVLTDGDNKTNIEGLSLTYDYNHKDYKLIDVPLKEEISFDTGTAIQFSRFQAWIESNQLDFTYKSDKHNMRSFYFQSSEPGYNLNMIGRLGAYVSPEEDGHYTVDFPAFREVPENLTLKITDLGLVGKKVVFTIPTNFDAKEKKIGEVLGTPFYFAGYDKGEFNGEEDTVILKLKWKRPDHVDQPEGDRLIRFYPRLYWRYKSRLQNAFNEEEKHRIKQNAESLVAIRNEEGERPNFFRRRGLRDKGNYEIIDLVLKQSYVKNAEHLMIQLSQLMYKHPIKPKTIEIPLTGE